MVFIEINQILIINKMYRNQNKIKIRKKESQIDKT